MKVDDGNGGTSGGGSRLPESIVTFVQQEVARLNQNAKAEHFHILVPALERAYMAAHAAFPVVGTPREAAIAHAWLLCHRSFLVAASLIARGHPDDAAGTNRRALEAAKAALAFRHDEKNWDEWASYEKRMKRWQDRKEGRRPERISPKLNLPQNHALLDELGKWLGMLSDTVHFTPEFVGSHELEKRPERQLYLNYFTDDAAELDRALRSLATVHIIILGVLDEAFGGAFGRDPAFGEAMDALRAAGGDLARRAGVPVPEEP